MDVDIYDEDLPEIYVSWADRFNESKDVIFYAGKFIAIPTSLFIATCIFNYYINKKWSSL